MLIHLVAVSDFSSMKRLTGIGERGDWGILLAVDTSEESEASSKTHPSGIIPAIFTVSMQRIMPKALMVYHRTSTMSGDSAGGPYLESLFSGSRSIRDSLSLRIMSKALFSAQQHVNVLYQLISLSAYKAFFTKSICHSRTALSGLLYNHLQNIWIFRFIPSTFPE